MVDSFWRPNMDIFTYSVFLLCPPRSCFFLPVWHFDIL